jgi:ERF superfamily
MADNLAVYKAINAVQAALSKIGIAKDQKNIQQGYHYRGVDSIYAAISPLLAQFHLVILPRVIARDQVERTTAKGSALFYTTLTVEFDFVSADDGSKHTVTVIGEAMDSGDKSSNKSMSAAYKYACLQAFCIPTEGDNDADATTHEVKAAGATKNPITPNAGAKDALSPQQIKKVDDLAIAIVELLGEARDYDALELTLGLTNEEKLGLWANLDSKARSALKKAAALAKENPVDRIKSMPDDIPFT